MKKLLTTFLLALSSLVSFSQFYAWSDLYTIDGSFVLDRVIINPYSETYMCIFDSNIVTFNLDTVKVNGLDSTKSNHVPLRNVAIDNTGRLYPSATFNLTTNAGGNSFTPLTQTLNISPEIDSSTTNEIQFIGGSGRTITLVGGGSYTLPVTSYDSLSNKPNLSLYYLATNPNGYISSYTETDPLFNANFAAKSTADLAEITNLYFTSARARSSISASGAGIGYNSSTGVITNTAPDQTVTISAGTNTSVTGTYPNFTISSATNISAPVAGNSITSGTAFQPNSSGPCMITINSSLSGALGITGGVTIAICPTQNGTYNTVAVDGLVISLLGLIADKSSGTIPIPAGYWVKVTYTNGATGNYTRWDL